MKLIAITFALVCNTIEPIQEYHQMKVVDEESALRNTERWGQGDGRDCRHLATTTPVEVIERYPDYPFVLKLRYSDPDKLIYGDKGEIAGKGATYEVYGDASDFADKMPKPKP